MKKKVILSVTNDLYTDPRVDKVCHSLLSFGFEVLLIGRKYVDSPKLPPKPYACKRFSMLFRKGALFYACFNLKLFFYLLFQQCDILVANDLDTLLPNFLVSKLRKKPLVYDSHEYFCGMSEIVNRPVVKACWLSIERFCFPRLKHVITVCQSIADLYEEEYKLKINVVRNIPKAIPPSLSETKASLGLPDDKVILILQGNAIHYNRGGEELIEALPLIHKGFLLIVGAGSAIPYIKHRVKELNIDNQVKFVDRVSPDLLFNYTYLSDIGITFDKDNSINHRFSLPNKLFEYIRAETPFITTDLPERRRIVETYQVGKIIPDLAPTSIAAAVNEWIENKEMYAKVKENCTKASPQLTWENEEKILKDLYCNLTS
ncbi:MAG: glycosyltransferase [Bacteroidales bacterium]|jgi:glycosyltransferase involved in cell wall biosynthesis|nr:glycosyltransferase [Bacteroidales bacterium]MDD3329825.1 glycosyltransferase [Bacteroidales bacterium]MDD3691218.1 glycosyltransferase [Bacteroidales bacterium]MDD4043941.1 glycosyltransferase [Bacteroidales bacterium]MDD4581071.1 glycosyltransferase [Bacteroidales bacterium]